MTRSAHYALFVSILSLGLFLRTISVGEAGLWADEGFTLAYANSSYATLMFSPFDPSGGLYYVLFKAFASDHWGPAAIRSMSVIFGLATIASAYWLARILYAPRVALFVAALVALSPPLIDYSQEARCYALLLLLLALSAVGLAGWLKSIGGEPDRRYLALFAITAVLSFYTHMTSVFWIGPAVVLNLFIILRSGKTKGRQAAIFATLSMWLLALPEAYRLFGNGSRYGGLGFLDLRPLHEALATSGDLLLPSALWKDPAAGPSSLSAALLCAATVLIGWRLYARRAELHDWRANHPGGASIVTMLAILPIFVWLFGVLLFPIFMPRTILAGALGFALLLGLVSHIDRWPMPVRALILAAFALHLGLAGTIRPKEAWAPMARILKQRIEPGDAVIMCQEWRAPSLFHALREASDRPVFLAFTRNIMSLEPMPFEAGWSDRARRAMILPVERSQPGKPTALGRATMIATPARFWVVRSECTRQIPNLRQWLGPGTERHIWDSPGTAYNEGTKLSLFEGRRMLRPVVFPAAE